MPVVQRAPIAPGTGTPAPTPTPAPQPLTSPTPPTRQQSAARATPPGPAPAPPATSRPIQRTSNSPTSAAPQTAPTTSTEPTTPTDPAALDALARRLVAPLSRLLRAELRGDRERIGRLRDHGR
ncbi:hypothetical protein [Streptomyces glebosus]|uniref:hypothetical protein n=1 Tax=Streptomyces glebosus TaxID=249580 RepID=UPI00167EF001|nr:hypothetical protein [Streptomyces glebosus]